MVCMEEVQHDVYQGQECRQQSADVRGVDSSVASIQRVQQIAMNADSAAFTS